MKKGNWTLTTRGSLFHCNQIVAVRIHFKNDVFVFVEQTAVMHLPGDWTRPAGAGILEAHTSLHFSATPANTRSSLQTGKCFSRLPTSILKNCRSGQKLKLSLDKRFLGDHYLAIPSGRTPHYTWIQFRRTSDSVPAATMIHRAIPCRSGRRPTLLRVSLFSPVPIRNSVTVRPILPK